MIKNSLQSCTGTGYWFTRCFMCSNRALFNFGFCCYYGLNLELEVLSHASLSGNHYAVFLSPTFFLLFSSSSFSPLPLPPRSPPPLPLLFLPEDGEEREDTQSQIFLQCSGLSLKPGLSTWRSSTAYVSLQGPCHKLDLIKIPPRSQRSTQTGCPSTLSRSA